MRLKVPGEVGPDGPRCPDPKRDYTRDAPSVSRPSLLQNPSWAGSVSTNRPGWETTSIRTSGAVRVGRGWEESGAPSSVPTIPFGCLVGVAVCLPSWDCTQRLWLWLSGPHAVLVSEIWGHGRMGSG